MRFDSVRERLSPVLGVPIELLDYQRWLDEQRRLPKTERDYLFAEEQPRFEPRRDDIVMALPGLVVTHRDGSTRLRGVDLRADIEIHGVSVEHAQRLLDAMDGKRCLLEVRWAAEVDQATMARFLRAAFGRVVLAPHAADGLESKLSCVEITRFPCSPYSVERPYWENMIAVRQHFVDCDREIQDLARFIDLLRELHVLALMGRDLDSFYKPSSPVSDRIVAPGSLYAAEPRLKRTNAGTIFVDGPRVNASVLGGEAYHRALYQDLGDPDALGDERELTQGGVSWGRVVHARSEKDDRPGRWFCPPRPMQAAHFELLRSELHHAAVASRAGQPDRALTALAHFHQALVRLHPFSCANQSLAMNLTNALLQTSHGSGIPHLILDHLALRLTPGGYEEAFRRAVGAFVVGEKEPAKRFAILHERKQRSFSLIRRIADVTSPSEVEAAIRQDPDGARWALLRA